MFNKLLLFNIVFLLFNLLNAAEFNSYIKSNNMKYVWQFKSSKKFSSVNKENLYLSDQHQKLLIGSTDSNNEVTSKAKSKNVFNDIYNAGQTFVSDLWFVTSSPSRLNWNSMIWLSSIVLTSGIIYTYDQEILDAFHRNQDNEFYDAFLHQGYNFERVGHMGVTNKYYFLGLGVGYLFNIKPMTTIMAQILESHFIAGAFKNLANIFVGRHRPFEENGPYSYSFNDGTSFPSGHASNIFQVATVLSHHVDYLPFDITVYGLATSVALQRIDSRNHWPSDVFVAAVYGTVVSRTVLSLHEKRKVKIVPEVNTHRKSFGVRFFLQL